MTLPLHDWIAKQMKDEREGLLDYKDMVLELRSLRRGQSPVTRRRIDKTIDTLKRIISDEEGHIQLLEKLL